MDDTEGTGGAVERSDTGDGQNESQVDRTAAKIKEIFEEARTKVEQAVEKVDVDQYRARTKEVLEEAKVKVEEAVGALRSKLKNDG